MKVTVCDLPDDPGDLSRSWEALIAHVRAQASELVLLPEMPFYPWFPRVNRFEQQVWEQALLSHERWQRRLVELAPAAVAGSQPVELDGLRLNEGFVWDQVDGLHRVHAKRYLPDEEGFWEATWYGRGPHNFSIASARGVPVGFLICTELWFLEHARAYGQKGAHLLLNPRGTMAATREKWLVGGQAAAVVSGAFVLSSNRTSREGEEPVFGGQGMVIGPDGDVLGLTSSDHPFLTVALDLEEAERAKLTYPRYVSD